MNLLEYHKSTGRELIAIKDRVRNLVQHWGEDGRYKENVLMQLLRKYLPEKYRIGTGFIVYTKSDNTEHTSNQIDLIIYDTKYPVLFKEGDFVIISPDAVQGIIEVKTNLQNFGFEKCYLKAVENGEFIFNGLSSDEWSKANRNQKSNDQLKRISYPYFFNGIFSYEGYNTFNERIIKDNIQKVLQNQKTNTEHEYYIPNHISFNDEFFYKYWPNYFDITKLPHKIYDLKDLSFSFFISNLLNLLNRDSIEVHNRLWYPLDKNIHMINNF